MPLTYRKSTAKKLKEQRQMGQEQAQQAAAEVRSPDVTREVNGGGVNTGTNTDTDTDADTGSTSSDGMGSLGDLFVAASEQRERRELQGDTWLTWEEAQNDGEIGPLRITFVTEFFDQGEVCVLVFAMPCIVWVFSVAAWDLTLNNPCPELGTGGYVLQYQRCLNESRVTTAQLPICLVYFVMSHFHNLWLGYFFSRRCFVQPSSALSPGKQ